MNQINSKEINETAWTGSSIDSKLTNNITSIELNCKSLRDAIKALKSYQGNLRTEEPTEIKILELTEREKAMHPEATSKHENIYETWDFTGLKDDYISCTNQIISEIKNLKELLSENSVQFADLERSAENLESEYNRILAATSASGIDIGSILLHNTDAPKKSGESGDRTLKGDYSGIDESNFYLYEKLKDGEYLYLVAGTGVEAGTYFIYKYTKDGNKVAMKNISADIVNDWANKCNDALQEKNKKTKDNVLNGLATVGAGIIGLGNKVKGAVNDKVKEMKENQAHVNKPPASAIKQTLRDIKSGGKIERDSATNINAAKEEQRSLRENIRRDSATNINDAREEQRSLRENTRRDSATNINDLKEEKKSLSLREKELKNQMKKADEEYNELNEKYTTFDNSDTSVSTQTNESLNLPSQDETSVTSTNTEEASSIKTFDPETGTFVDEISIKSENGETNYGQLPKETSVMNTEHTKFYFINTNNDGKQIVKDKSGEIIMEVESNKQISNVDQSDNGNTTVTFYDGSTLTKKGAYLVETNW